MCVWTSETRAMKIIYLTKAFSVPEKYIKKDIWKFDKGILTLQIIEMKAEEE